MKAIRIEYDNLEELDNWCLFAKTQNIYCFDNDIFVGTDKEVERIKKTTKFTFIDVTLIKNKPRNKNEIAMQKLALHKFSFFASDFHEFLRNGYNINNLHVSISRKEMDRFGIDVYESRNSGYGTYTQAVDLDTFYPSKKFWSLIIPIVK